MEVNRDEAWTLFCEWTQSDSLRKHVLGVEAAMRAYARKSGEDEELWAITGIVHDLDYERYPDLDTGHPRHAIEELRRLGYPDEVVDAVAGHATFLNVPRETSMAKTLFAVDELSGFIAACALVRPTGILGKEAEIGDDEFPFGVADIAGVGLVSDHTLSFVANWTKVHNTL